MLFSRWALHYVGRCDAVKHLRSTGCGESPRCHKKSRNNRSSSNVLDLKIVFKGMSIGRGVLVLVVVVPPLSGIRLVFKLRTTPRMSS